MDVGNFIPEFSVTGLLWTTASVICGGKVRCFFHSVGAALHMCPRHSWALTD